MITEQMVQERSRSPMGQEKIKESEAQCVGDLIRI